MKNKRDIRIQISKLAKKYKEKIAVFEGMSDEEKKSKEAAELLKEIWKLEGSFLTFKWVLQK
jgi:RNase H-fold protein (predicted Holliday junction resolvase)